MNNILLIYFLNPDLLSKNVKNYWLNIIMFCSPSSYVDSNLNNLPFPKAAEEGEFKNE